MSKAKDTRVNSGDFDDASRALMKIGNENNDLQSENTTLKSAVEQLNHQLEQTQQDALGMREQGPQAVKDQYAADLSAENERLKKELHRHIAAGGPPPSPSLQLNEDKLSHDPFIPMLATYLESHLGSGSNSTQQQLTEDQQRFSPEGQRNNAATLCTTDNRAVLNAGSVAQQRRILRRSHSASSSVSRFVASSPPSVHELNTTSTTTNSVQYRPQRRHSEMSNPLVVNAGITAQRRRYRRCQSASSVSQSRRSSLKNFVDMLNSDANEDGQMSWLASLVVHLLVTAQRQIEAQTLKRLLRNPITSTKTEDFLLYTVIRDLVAKLQSPHCTTGVEQCPSISGGVFLWFHTDGHQTASSDHKTLFLPDLHIAYMYY